MCASRQVGACLQQRSAQRGRCRAPPNAWRKTAMARCQPRSACDASLACQHRSSCVRPNPHSISALNARCGLGPRSPPSRLVRHLPSGRGRVSRCASLRAGISQPKQKPCNRKAPANRSKTHERRLRRKKSSPFRGARRFVTLVALSPRPRFRVEACKYRACPSHSRYVSAIHTRTGCVPKCRASGDSIRESAIAKQPSLGHRPHW